MTQQPRELSRRHALAGAATVGVGVPLLAACSGDESGATATDPTSSAPASSGGGEPGEGGEPGAALAATSDIEVGGGTIFADEKVVVTQPTEGEFKAFSATCTHQGCAVGSVSDGLIHCPCHNSQFSIADGSTQGGPATAPLPEVAIAVKGDRITLA